jgi:hypothetical protein
MRSRSCWIVVVVGAAMCLLAGCGAAGSGLSGSSTSAAASGLPGSSTSAAATRLVQWKRYRHIQRVLDLAGPQPDGALVAAAAGKLWLLHRSGAVTPYAPAYSSPGGEEPYIAMAPHGGHGCRFDPAAVYAIRLRPPRGVVAISPRGRVRQFARIAAAGLIDGIAFDLTGAFQHRLLVTVNAGSRTTVEAIDCHGAVTTITRRAPRVEGGIAVAPASFGHFAGDLIAPDETGGRMFAITPRGRVRLLASSGLPHGRDIGVESAGFVPAGAVDALVADRLTPGNPHPGDDFVLRLRSAALTGAGVRAGDLLVATEGGARTDAIRCTVRGCRVRHVADGPPEAHGEGHVAFARAS